MLQIRAARRLANVNNVWRDKTISPAVNKNTKGSWPEFSHAVKHLGPEPSRCQRGAASTPTSARIRRFQATTSLASCLALYANSCLPPLGLSEGSGDGFTAGTLPPHSCSATRPPPSFFFSSSFISSSSVRRITYRLLLVWIS